MVFGMHFLFDAINGVFWVRQTQMMARPKRLFSALLFHSIGCKSSESECCCSIRDLVAKREAVWKKLKKKKVGCARRPIEIVEWGFIRALVVFPSHTRCHRVLCSFFFLFLLSSTTFGHYNFIISKARWRVRIFIWSSLLPPPPSLRRSSSSVDRSRDNAFRYFFDCPTLLQKQPWHVVREGSENILYEFPKSEPIQQNIARVLPITMIEKLRNWSSKTFSNAFRWEVFRDIQSPRWLQLFVSKFESFSSCSIDLMLR